MSIGRRLTLAFGSLALVIAAGGAITGWEFVASLRQAKVLVTAGDKVIALYRVRGDVGEIRLRLDTAATTHNAAQFFNTADILRRQLFEHIQQALSYFRETGTPVPGTLSALGDTVGDQLDAMQRLVSVNDWTAVGLRIDNQLDGILDSVRSMVERVNADVSDQRTRFTREIEVSQRRAQVVLAVTAIASLLIALGLGLYVTRSIVTPLGALETAAHQFAQGDFDVALAIRSNDELGEVSHAFNAAARQLNDYYSALKLSNEALEQFAYAASHDLQEPLRTIASFSELLKRRYGNALPSEANQYLAYVIDASSQMQKLVAGILEYSRLTTSGDQQEKVVDTDDVLRIVLNNLHATIAQTSAQVTYDALPRVMGSAPQLVRLFQNLIGNAIKYCREDTSPRVHISATRRYDLWEFCIEDNGIGIEPKFHEHVFKMFKQLDRGLKGGVGLGLAISKRIVERHGGTIWVASNPNKGSRFYFTLKAAIEQDTDPQEAAAQSESVLKHSSRDDHNG